MGLEHTTAEKIDVQLDWSRLKRLGLGLLAGILITSTTFWAMMSSRVPWQFNLLLAPGAIVGMILGVLTHYPDYYYTATLLGVNVIFYGILTYAS